MNIIQFEAHICTSNLARTELDWAARLDMRDECPSDEAAPFVRRSRVRGSGDVWGKLRIRFLVRSRSDEGVFFTLPP